MGRGIPRSEHALNLVHDVPEIEPRKTSITIERLSDNLTALVGGATMTVEALHGEFEATVIALGIEFDGSGLAHNYTQEVRDPERISEDTLQVEKIQ